MATDDAVAQIACRFGTERIEIMQYVNFMRDQCAIHVQEIVELNTLLKRFCLPELPTREHLATNDHHLTPAEITALTCAINRLTPTIDRVVSELNRSANDIPLLAGEIAEDGDAVGNWADHAMKHLPDDPRTAEYHAAEEKILAEVGKRRDGEDEPSAAQRRLIINEGLRHARSAKLRNIENALQYALDRFRTIKAIDKLVAPNAIAGTLRQGFILLVTTFDAAIFDLVRVKLRKDFFSLIGTFAKDERISVQEFGEAGSFEVLRDSIIERQLKRRYIRDLLYILEKLGVECIDKSDGQRFVQLIELVLRRNVHVHSRGVVDDRYLELDQNGKPKCNPYNFAAGDDAQIDEPYWQLANLLCSTCVNRVAAWADG